MRKTRGLTLALLALPAALGAQTSLSIYRDGRVLVRQSLAQALQQGRNTVTLGIEGLDPATLFSPDSQVSIVSTIARFPSTQDDALRRAVGQTIAFAREKDTVRATVVRVDPPQVRLADGRLFLGWPGQPLFPAGLVRSQPEAQLVLEATRARPRTDVAFVGEGMSWEAVYQVVLGRTQATVNGAATVTSSSLRADSAEVQLVAGSIRRTRAPKAYADEGRAMMFGEARAAAAPASEMTEESVGETHVYALPGRLSIEPNVPVATALFPRASVPVTQELVLPGVLPWRGSFGGWSTEPVKQPVQVWYTLKRSRGSAFGDRPLPAGTAQVYQADAAGRLQLVGEAAINHTPAGKDVRMQTSDAFDVTAERVQTDYNLEQLPPPRKGMPSPRRVTAGFRVTLTNAKAEAVTVDVREAHFGEWKVTASSVPAEKLSASEVRFRVSVPAGGTTTLTYTVQIDS
jgi:hypothetical protein